jgi:hypothetical protein
VRALLLATLCTWGCTFQPGTVDDMPAGDDPGSGGGGGGVGPTDVDAGIEPTALSCTFADPELRLCLELDDRKFSPGVTDYSQRQLQPTATDVNEVRHGAGYAAAMTLTSRIDVPESTALDPQTALTIEMWIWPAYQHSANLVVNANQYTLQLAGDGRIGCLLPAGATWSSDEHVAKPQQWTHIACTFAPGNGLHVYVNGRAEDGSSASSGGLSTQGTQGTRVGFGFGGGLDDIRIYGRALSSQEVCTHAGATDCE